jgi:hypothetical protein
MNASRIVCVAALVCSVLAGCVSTHTVPKFQPDDTPAPAWGDRRYPPTSIRLEGGGKEPVEFFIDEHRKPFGAKVLQSASVGRDSRLEASASSRLIAGAIHLIDAASFDPNDHTRTHTNTQYLVTVSFCLDGNSSDCIRPYPNSTILVIEGYRMIRQPMKTDSP